MSDEDLTLRNDVTGALIACNRYTGGSNDKIVQVIIETCKQANAAAEFRHAVAEALATLEHGLRADLFHTHGMHEAAMQMLATTREQLGLDAAKEEGE